jgi:hypothetical protein
MIRFSLVASCVVNRSAASKPNYATAAVVFFITQSTMSGTEVLLRITYSRRHNA